MSCSSYICYKLNGHLNPTVQTEIVGCTQANWVILPMFSHSVDDAFVQTMKHIFGGDGNKKNLVDPFLEARFAGRKVSCSVTCEHHCCVTEETLICGLSVSPAVYSDHGEECKPRVEPSTEPPSEGKRLLGWKTWHKRIIITIDIKFQTHFFKPMSYVFCSSPLCVSVSNWRSLIGKSNKIAIYILEIVVCHFSVQKRQCYLDFRVIWGWDGVPQHLCSVCVCVFSCFITNHMRLM